VTIQTQDKNLETDLSLPLPGAMSRPSEASPLTIAMLGIASVLLALFTSGWFHVAFGLALVLLLPGYAVAAAAFPRSDDLEALERLALSFGLSVAISMLIGLGLSYSPWSATSLTSPVSLALFVILTSTFAQYRRRRLFPASTGLWDFRTWSPRKLARLQGHTHVAPSALLVGACVLLAATVAYSRAPVASSRGAEFYVLGRNGKAGSYPQHIVGGKPESVVLALVNGSQRDDYRVTTAVNGKTVGHISGISLQPGKRWERIVNVHINPSSRAQRVDFLLSKRGAQNPYRYLRLWVRVGPR
jgi:uncharacterized membrane protein